MRKFSDPIINRIPQIDVYKGLVLELNALSGIAVKYKCLVMDYMFCCSKLSTRYITNKHLQISEVAS